MLLYRITITGRLTSRLSQTGIDMDIWATFPCPTFDRGFRDMSDVARIYLCVLGVSENLSSAYSYQRRSRVGLMGMFVARQVIACFDRENVDLRQPSSLNGDVHRSRFLLEGGPSGSPGPHWLVYFMQTPLDAREVSARAFCSAAHAFAFKP